MGRWPEINERIMKGRAEFPHNPVSDFQALRRNAALPACQYRSAVVGVLQNKIWGTQRCMRLVFPRSSCPFRGDVAPWEDSKTKQLGSPLPGRMSVAPGVATGKLGSCSRYQLFHGSNSGYWPLPIIKPLDQGIHGRVSGLPQAWQGRNKGRAAMSKTAQRLSPVCDYNIGINGHKPVH